VDPLGQHALSCKRNAGRVQRQAWLNGLIYHALIRSEIPAVKEPQALSRNDGKRPDSLTLVPWQSGRSATWDVTVVHTLAASYVSQSATQVGSAATAASERKTAKYSNLSFSHVFYPVAVETLGALADDGTRATLCTTDPRETTFLYQRISVAIYFCSSKRISKHAGITRVIFYIYIAQYLPTQWRRYAANVIVIDVIVNISIPCALKSYLFKLTVSFVPVYNTFAKKRVISDHFVGHSVLDDLLS